MIRYVKTLKQLLFKEEISMNENTKRQSPQVIEDEALDDVTGGADFARYKGYEATCNDCGHKWTSATEKPKECAKCGSTNIRVY